ncbi:hypothetical protein LCGC14_2279710, partial [marine sediment metagenome]
AEALAISGGAATNQTFFIGTTQVAINRASAALVLTGITSIDGLAATATALASARTIGGVSFDGTAAITVASATGGFAVSGGNFTSTGTLQSGAAAGTNGQITLTGSTSGTGVIKVNVAAGAGIVFQLP